MIQHKQNKCFIVSWNGCKNVGGVVKLNIRDARKQVNRYFGDWIKIIDYRSEWTIKDFSFKEGVPQRVENHCRKCVTVNHCWFLDEVDKKPSEYDYLNDYVDEAFSFGKNSLYHPNCHCEKFVITNPIPADIKLIETEGKIEYMWKDKIHLIHLWGYLDFEKDKFVEMLAQKTKESYVAGNYEVEQHNNHGVKINCFFRIPCRNPKFGKEIGMWSNWMVFPDGTLKCNSYLGGWSK